MVGIGALTHDVPVHLRCRDASVIIRAGPRIHPDLFKPQIRGFVAAADLAFHGTTLNSNDDIVRSVVK